MEKKIEKTNVTILKLKANKSEEKTKGERPREIMMKQNSEENKMKTF